MEASLSKFVNDFESLIGKNEEFVVKDTQHHDVSWIRQGCTDDHIQGAISLLLAKAEIPNDKQVGNLSIKLHEGQVNYDQLQVFVKSLPDEIYVRGLEKAQFISWLTGTPVFELRAAKRFSSTDGLSTVLITKLQTHAPTQQVDHLALGVLNVCPPFVPIALMSRFGQDDRRQPARLTSTDVTRLVNTSPRLSPVIAETSRSGLKMFVPSLPTLYNR